MDLSCKWLLAIILVVVGLFYLHLQANFIPKEIAFVGMFLLWLGARKTT